MQSLSQIISLLVFPTIYHIDTQYSLNIFSSFFILFVFVYFFSPSNTRCYTMDQKCIIQFLCYNFFFFVNSIRFCGFASRRSKQNCMRKKRRGEKKENSGVQEKTKVVSNFRICHSYSRRLVPLSVSHVISLLSLALFFSPFSTSFFKEV